MTRRIAASIVVLTLFAALGAFPLLRGCLRGETAPTSDIEAPWPDWTAIDAGGWDAALRTPLAWSDIPDLIAIHPVGILPASAAPDSAPAAWSDFLSGTVALLAPTMTADEHAAMIRAVGYLNTIDFLIGHVAGLKQRRQAAHPDKAAFPAPLCTGFLTPANTSLAITKVLAIVGDPSALAARLPLRLHGAGLADAVRARAALFAGSLGPDARTLAVLYEASRTAGDPRVRAASAYGLLGQNVTAACRAILTGDDARATSALLGALTAAAPHVVTGTVNGRRQDYGVMKPFADRSLDALIPPLLHTKEDHARATDYGVLAVGKEGHVRAMAFGALAVRVDDPAIAKYLIDQMYYARATECVRALVLGFPPPGDVANASLLDIYEGWLTWDEPAVRRCALVALSRMRSPRVPAILAGHAGSEDVRFSRGVLDAIQGSAALDPTCAFAAVVGALGKWRGDGHVVDSAVSILRTLDGCSAAPYRIRARAGDLLADLR